MKSGKSVFVKSVAVAALVAGTFAAIPGAVPGAQAAEKVTYLLPAPAFLPAFGPWQVAKARGYYAAEGLDVTFQSGRGGVDTAKQIGAGNAPIGGALGDTPIIVRPNGIPVKAVAQLGGRSLMNLTVAADAGINGPKDLKGKTVTVLSYSDTTYYALLGMMASVGLSKKDVNIQAAGPTGVWQLFLQGKSQAMASVPDWTAIAIGRKKKIKIFPADEYFESMSQVIVASDKTIAANPELVQKLVRATLKGLVAIKEDPVAAAKDYVKAVAQWKGKEGAVIGTFKLYNKLVYPGQEKVGVVNAKRLASLQEFYFKEGFIKKKTPVAELYTNQFVE